VMQLGFPNHGPACPLGPALELVGQVLARVQRPGLRVTGLELLTWLELRRVVVQRNRAVADLSVLFLLGLGLAHGYSDRFRAVGARHRNHMPGPVDQKAQDEQDAEVSYGAITLDDDTPELKP